MINCSPLVQIVDIKLNEAWVPIVARWHHDEWLNHHEGLNGQGRSPRMIHKKLLERQASLGNHLGDEPLPTTFVALLGTEPVGTVSVVYYNFTAANAATEWLTNLYVLPQHRCRGIASELLHAAMAYADSLAIERLLLYTNDQMAFYKKRHWRSVNNGVVQGQVVEIMDYEFLPPQKAARGH